MVFFAGGNRSKTIQKRFGNIIEILIEYFEIWKLQKIQLLIEYLGSQIEPAEPPLRGGVINSNRTVVSDFLLVTDPDYSITPRCRKKTVKLRTSN